MRPRSLLIFFLALITGPAYGQSDNLDSAMSLGTVVKVRELPHWRVSLDSALKDLPTVLGHFTPSLRRGARLVNAPVVTMTKEGLPVLNVGIIMYFHTAFMRGEVRQVTTLCGPEETTKGFRIDMNVDQSDPLISDSISASFMDICAVEGSTGTVTFTAHTFIKKGPHYQDGSPVTKTVLTVVSDQLDPLLSALIDVAVLNSAKTTP